MDKQQTLTAVAAFLPVLQSFRTLMDLAAVLSHQEQKECESRRIKKRKREDDDLAAVSSIAIMLDGNGYNFRRFWVDTRSNHWIRHVLNGMVLRETEFDKVFRMSRDTFNKLHDILRMNRLQRQVTCV
jgi:hypothetical protein